MTVVDDELEMVTKDSVMVGVIYGVIVTKVVDTLRAMEDGVIVTKVTDMPASVVALEGGTVVKKADDIPLTVASVIEMGAYSRY